MPIQRVEVDMNVIRRFWPNTQPHVQEDEFRGRCYVTNWGESYISVGKYLFLQKDEWSKFLPAIQEHSDQVIMCALRRGILSENLGFSSGVHLQNALVLMQAYREMFRGANVIENGSGWGILGTLASRLGASHIYGIEKDEKHYGPYQEHAGLNGVENTTLIKDDFVNISRIPELQNADIAMTNLPDNGFYRCHEDLRPDPDGDYLSSWHLFLAEAEKPKYYFMFGMDEQPTTGQNMAYVVRDWLTGKGWEQLVERTLPKSMKYAPTSFVFKRAGLKQAT